MKPTSGSGHINLVTAFAEALAQALSSVTGAAFRATAPPSVEPPADLLVWRQELRPLTGAGLFLGAGADLWTTAGRRMLAAAGISDAANDDSREAWHEIAAQAIGSLASTLSTEIGRELTVGGGEEVPTAPELKWRPLGIEGPDGIYGVVVAWPESLTTLLITPPTVESADENSRTLDLLLDVALPVAVSFGRTSLQIREVLKLNTGSVIELNRLIHEPVDLVINDSVIARGEVVVVDGNYGVRIIQLASREDRIRTGIASAASIRTDATA